MAIFCLVLGLAILYYYNYNRKLGIELASRHYQEHSIKILIVGLCLCALAGIL